MTTSVMGENGFRWFVGSVVDRKSDPQKLGRVRVRIYGVHDDVASTPDNELPWASIVNLPISASANQVGVSPLGIMEGTVVVGFFADGTEGQLPMILGTIAGVPNNDVNKHDVAKLAREENDLAETKTQQRVIGELVTEPVSPYAAKYPFNKVLRTERGHVIELDDTENKERMHMYHRKGTYTEIDQEGRRVDKIVGDRFEVTVKNNNVYVGGECKVEIVGDTKIRIKGNAAMTVDGTTDILSRKIMTIASDTEIVMKAPIINLNPNSSKSVTSTEPVPSPSQPEKKNFAGFVQPNVRNYRWGV